MSLEHQNPGSFRDPYSSVFEVNGRVFRGIERRKSTFAF